MDTGTVILAAGPSTRMKQCKALLDYAGESAIARLARGAREGGGSTDIVVVAAEPHYREVSEEAVNAGCRVVQNPAPRAGRTMSVQIGLKHLGDPEAAAFVAPVDCPVVQPADFLALRHAIGSDDPKARGAIAAVPLSGSHHGHPILLTPSGIGMVLRMHPNDPLRELLRDQRDRVLDVALPARVLLNIDTPVDYANARRELGLASKVRAGA